MIKIKISGDTALQKSLGQNFKPVIAGGIRKIATIVHENTQSEAPHKTGKFARSIVKVPSGDLGWHIVETDKLGGLIRHGSPRHSIYPKKARGALYYSSLPHPISRANHPGTRANPYPTRGVSKSMGEVQTVVDSIGAEIAKKIG